MGRTTHRTTRGATQVQPRYGRLAAAGSAVTITLLSVAGGIGWLPVDEPAVAATTHHDAAKQPAAGSALGSDAGSDAAGSTTDGSGAAGPMTEPQGGPTVAGAQERRGLPAHHYTRPVKDDAVQTDPAPVPADSGIGKRVVFDMSAQRVWLVDPDAAEEVERTYLVSGSVTDNLHPGSYSVYSRSLHAIGVDDSGTMDYMVRFTQGASAAIGFHDIPVKDGELVQTRAQLGTPRSHGCIRQWRPDAEALWDFAPVGTSVVVVA